MRSLVPLILLALPALALAGPPPQWQPVDQAVADLDPLSVSQRHMETGLRSTGEQSSLYRVPAPVPPDGDASLAAPAPPPVYYRIGPGFRARVTRLDYLVEDQHGQPAMNIAPAAGRHYFEIVGANSVFELAPAAPGTAAATPGQGGSAARWAPAPLWLPGTAPIRRAGPAVVPVDAAPVAAHVAGQIDGRVAGQIDGRAAAPSR
jgi:hypothetical protein